MSTLPVSGALCEMTDTDFKWFPENMGQLDTTQVLAIAQHEREHLSRMEVTPEARTHISNAIDCMEASLCREIAVLGE